MITPQISPPAAGVITFHHAGSERIQSSVYSASSQAAQLPSPISLRNATANSPPPKPITNAANTM